MTLASRRRLLGALALAPLAACEEMRTPPNRNPLPPDLAPAGDWTPRDVLNSLAEAFANQGQQLVGRPAAMARAVGQLEYATNLLLNDRRYSMVDSQVRISMRLAREEVRQAIGIAPGAAPSAVIGALAACVKRLGENNRTAAAAALSPGVFLPGGMASFTRMSRPGPLPLAEQATARLHADVQRLDAINGWDGALATIVPAAADSGVERSLTPGLGRGY